MNPLLHSMPVDWTGVALSNRTRGEYHSLLGMSDLAYRCLVLDHGYFYTENLYILDGNGKELKEDLDYQCVSFNAEVVGRTGKACCAVIVILNSKVNENLYIDASMVGGPYEIVGPAIVQMAQGLLNNTRKLHWNNVSGKPDDFAAGGHMQALWDLHGFTPQVTSLQRIAMLRSAKAGKVFDDLYTLFAADMAGVEAELNAAEAVLTSHLNETDNPHRETANSISLGNVVNATTPPVGAAAKGATAFYATPASVALVIASNFSSELTDHIGNRANPHRNTAAQLRVHTNTEFNNIMIQYADRGSTMYYTSSTWGATPDSQIAEFRYNNSMANITSGMYPKERIAGGLPGAGYVMLPYGLWQSFPSVMSVYEKKAGVINYLSGNFTGFYGAQATANTYCTNLTTYPIGSLLIFHFVHEERSNTSNGTAIARIQNTGMMTRTANGWLADGV